MLHLASGIALSVNVADFLELQRALEGHRILRTPAQIEDVTRGDDERRDRCNVLVVVERRVECGGRFLKVRHDRFLFVAAEMAVGARQVGGKRGKHRELARERLGRSHADFGPSVRRQQQVRLARHRTCRHIDHHRDPLLLCARMAQRGERICGFARLRNEQRKPARLQDRLAVTELTRDIDVDRDARELLDPIFRDQAGVIAGAAGDDC